MDELTKRAMEMAKKSKPEKKTTTENDAADKQTVKIQKKENEIVLGKNKVVHIKPWTGKTKKKTRKLFENLTDPEDIDLWE